MYMYMSGALLAAGCWLLAVARAITDIAHSTCQGRNVVEGAVHSFILRVYIDGRWSMAAAAAAATGMRIIQMSYR